MATYEIRKAQRGNAKPLVGIHSLSGHGKTYTSLVLARGCVGPTGKIIQIETEEGRGESYADPTEYPEIGGYDVISMRDNFSPRNFGDAIDAATKAKPDALIIDSGSAEWSGIGGVLDMAHKNEEAGKKGLSVWQRPKIDHQTYFLGRILQSPIPLVILCCRSKFPMVEKWNEQKKKKEPVRSDVLEPIQSEDILYEMFIHGFLDKEHRFHIGKITNKSLATVFIEGEPISPATGQRLAAWMAGRRDITSEKKQTPASAEAKTDTSGAILFIDAHGEAKTCGRWSEWVRALEDALNEAPTPEMAQALWEHNEDTFLHGEGSAKGNEAKAAFAKVGKLALEKRMAPTTAGEDERL